LREIVGLSGRWEGVLLVVSRGTNRLGQILVALAVVCPNSFVPQEVVLYTRSFVVETVLIDVFTYCPIFPRRSTFGFAIVSPLVSIDQFRESLLSSVVSLLSNGVVWRGQLQSEQRYIRSIWLSNRYDCSRRLLRALRRHRVRIRDRMPNKRPVRCNRRKASRAILSKR
jgi:hypothetical protein